MATKRKRVSISGPCHGHSKRSYREGRLSPSWKEVDIVPVPKQKPVKDVNKHLRPISLTPISSKVAEEFVVEEHVKPAMLKKIGANQFGCVPKSSTTHALIIMMHAWTKHTDGNGATVRVVLFDYRKAFDLIDHAILAGNLMALNIPQVTLYSVISFDSFIIGWSPEFVLTSNFTFFLVNAHAHNEI